MLTHLCGAGLGFLGFSLCLIIGLYVNNSFIEVIRRALVILVLFYLLGYILARLGSKIIQENFDHEIQAAQNQMNNQTHVSPDTLEKSTTAQPPVAV